MEKIAIIGVGCRFPQAENPASFWQLLSHKVDAISELSSRPFDWDVLNQHSVVPKSQTNSIWGGFLQNVENFDPSFFGISPKEAERMDPQQRLLLEVAWESLENAAIVPAVQLSHSKTGVFIGVCGYDYAVMLGKQQQINAYNAIGNTLAIIANRLSYILNLQGPSLVVDTACSSSLVALHYACQSLQTGESNLCLAGGVNLILSPEGTISVSHAQMMAADGRCKTFDAAADGYVRGEGCGVVVLKRLNDAIRDGDNIQAIIRGSAVNQDGLSNGLTAPNGPSQQAVIRQALANAEVKPSQISYVETHGTGTSLGDPIEVNSLKRVLMDGREADQPCCIGSVKTNIGHLEAAAGIAGLIKVVLSLQHRQIPPHLHFKQLNPYIKLKNTPIQIPTELQQWPAQAQPRLAGVSAFGFGGTNAHAILEEAPTQVRSQKSKVKSEGFSDRSYHLLTLSAKCETALQELASRYQYHLKTDSHQAIADICYTANTGRSQFNHRLALVAEAREGFIDQLGAFIARQDTPGLLSGQVTRKKPPKIAFLFTGQGSQYLNMGRQLYDSQPIFRQTIDQCNQILRPYLDHSLLDILYPSATEEEAGSLLDQTVYTQPALFAIEYSLYQLWKSWGIEPDVVMGHSVGEYVAACVAGIFSLEEGLQLIAHRGRLMQQLPPGGEMVALMASEEQVKAVIAPYAETIAIAAVNGPESVVISGVGEDIHTICQQLEAEGIKTKRLQVSHGFHSPLMEPMLAEFAAVAEEVTYHQPQIPVISNVTGQLGNEQMATGQYWVDHVRQPVRFAQSMETLDQQGGEDQIFLEMGPKPILLGMGRQCLSHRNSLWLPSLRPGVDDWQQMFLSLGQLYVRGFQVNGSEHDRGYQRQKVVLPTYPFQRQRYWIETDSLPPQKQYLPKNRNLHPLLGQKLHLAGLENQLRFESHLSIDEPAYLTHHRVFDKPVLPATAYLEMALAAGASLLKSDRLILEDVNIYQALIFSEDRPKTVQVILKSGETDIYTFEIFSLNLEENSEKQSSILHASGKVMKGQEPSEIDVINLSSWQNQYPEKIPIDILYRELAAEGMMYGSSFQAVKHLGKSEEKTLGLIELSPENALNAEQYKIHPALLDSCLHSGYGFTLELDAVSSLDIYLPIRIERLKIYNSGSYKLWSQVKISPPDNNHQETSTTDALLFDENGVVVAEIEGLVGKRVSRQALLNLLQKQLLGDIQSQFYQTEWQPQPQSAVQADSQGQELSHWLIFADGAGLGQALATQLQQQGHECTLVYRGETYQNQTLGSYQLNASNPEEFEQLYQEIRDTCQLPLQRIIHLWSIDAPASKDLTISALEESQVWGCGSVLHLLQGIIKNPGPSSPQLWLVTRGSQAVESSPSPLNRGIEKIEKIAVAQSPLWGLGRVVSLEYPQLWGGLVDLDPQTPANEADTLLGLIANNTEEDHLAWRSGQTYVCRLVKQTPTASVPVSLSPDATYLITGGLGALGLHTAQWMVDRGGRSLVLISRRQPSAAAQTAISRLQEKGAKVVVHSADVCNVAELKTMLEQLEKTLPPLKGIVHGAGVGGYQALAEMELGELEAVMGPKVIGGWILHQLTQNKELDFFVSFSSIAGVWGAAGQAHYGAANHFLDMLTAYRQDLGLPSLSVSWGPWAGGGMANEEALRELSKRGVKSLSPKNAIAALDHLSGRSQGHTTVADVNWSLFKQLYDMGRQRGLLEQIEAEVSATTASTTASTSGENPQILQQIKASATGDRLSLLTAYLQKKVGKIIGVKGNQLPLAEQSFFEMGMDSLMVVELRNQIKTDLRLDIPMTTLMQGGTISILSTQLNHLLFPLNGIPIVESEIQQQLLIANVKENDWIEIEI